jgi:D-alanyl-D-alanine carboxypeptidase/Type IV secretion system pilin
MSKRFSKIIKFTFAFFFFFSVYNFSFTQNVMAECGSPEDNNCYTLLESITGSEGGIDEITIQADGLGAYLEMIMSYLLVLVTIAAVFYMIYGGVLYLTTDIINQKKEGKEVITRVIIGLIFVFSVWTIMNSINSGLLKNSLDFSLKKIGVTVGSAVSTTLSTIAGVRSASSTPSSPVEGCSSGLVTIQGSYQLCSTVADNMKKLISAASSNGINLTLSSAFRDKSRQIALRRKNCGPTDYDIYQKPSRECTPQTAIPGTSNHERGLAVDFADMQSQNSNYQWLVENAGKYGFKNDIASTKEPWHWSTNGR